MFRYSNQVIARRKEKKTCFLASSRLTRLGIACIRFKFYPKSKIKVSLLFTKAYQIVKRLFLKVVL